MDTTTINRILRSEPSTRHQYSGCFPSDALRLPHSYPSAVVANLDPMDRPGSHWVALYMRSPTRVDYFDSYGLPPIGDIGRFLANFKERTTNNCIIQSVNSRVCGHYCIFFLTSRCRGLSYERIITILTRQRNPDSFVANYVTELCTL